MVIIMKLKFRKIIIIIFMLTMCIGIGMLGLSIPGGRYTDDSKSLDMGERTAKEEDSENRSNIVLASSLLSPTVNPTMPPTPTPYPIYPLEENSYPKEIDALIDTYYKAKVSCDMDTLKSISTDPEAVIDKESIQKLIDGIDEYLNMKCYVKRTYLEDFYLVWVYYDIQFIGLETYAPSLSKFYVKRDTDGSYKVFDGVLDKELKTYIDARNEDQDVLELKKYTDDLASKAKEKDEYLSAFWEILEKR